MEASVPPEIDARTAAQRLADREATVLDVRDHEEWAAGRIAGTVHVPLPELVARQDEVPEQLPLIVVCRSGSRSAWAVQMLVRGGYRASNLAGGLQAWEAAGLPLEPEGAYVA
jgi:rhodanese-related sulfurtransferase